MSAELIGPLRGHLVAVEGRVVPYLTAAPIDGGKVLLTLDRRFSIAVDVADFDRTVRFIADCIAVASGYSCHPHSDEDPVKRQIFPRILSLDVEGTR